MMRPQIDPARCCLPVAKWPSADKEVWLTALAAADPLSLERSVAAFWKPATVHKNRRGYGRWLTFLQNSGADLSLPMAGRVTPQQAAAYLVELRQQGVSAYTLRNRILELYAVMRALASDYDWTWLQSCVAHLDRKAQDAADRSLPPVLAFDLLDRCKIELRRRECAAASWREAIVYRNWLMLMILTILPLRLRNFAALSLDRHLVRRDGTWRIDIDGSETKTGRPHAASLPSEEGTFLDHYLFQVRPALDQDIAGGRLWLSSSGAPLAEHTIYITITDLTRRNFGTALNPHLFRHILATSVSIADPEAIEGARAALGHATRRSTQHHYNRAFACTSARIHGDIVRRLRARNPSTN